MSILENQFYLISFSNKNDFVFGRYVTNKMPIKKELNQFDETEDVLINVQEVGSYYTNELKYKKIEKRGKINWK